MIVMLKYMMLMVMSSDDDGNSSHKYTKNINNSQIPGHKDKISRNQFEGKKDSFQKIQIFL